MAQLAIEAPLYIHTMGKSATSAAGKFVEIVPVATASFVTFEILYKTVPAPGFACRSIRRKALPAMEVGKLDPRSVLVVLPDASLCIRE